MDAHRDIEQTTEQLTVKHVISSSKAQLREIIKVAGKFR